MWEGIGPELSQDLPPAASTLRLTARTLAGRRTGLTTYTPAVPRDVNFDVVAVGRSPVPQRPRKKRCEPVVVPHGPPTLEIGGAALLEVSPRRPVVPRSTTKQWTEAPAPPVAPERSMSPLPDIDVDFVFGPSIIEEDRPRKPRPRSSQPWRNAPLVTKKKPENNVFSYLDEAVARLRATADMDRSVDYMGRAAKMSEERRKRPWTAQEQRSPPPGEKHHMVSCPSCRWMRGHRCSYCLLAKSSPTPRLTLREVGTRLLKADPGIKAVDLLEKLERYGRLSEFAADLNPKLSRIAVVPRSQPFCKEHAEEREDLEHRVERRDAELATAQSTIESQLKKVAVLEKKVEIMKMADDDNEETIASMTRMLATAAAEERKLIEICGMAQDEADASRRALRSFSRSFESADVERRVLRDHNAALADALVQAEGSLRQIPRLRRQLEVFESLGRDRILIASESQTPSPEINLKSYFDDPTAIILWVTGHPNDEDFDQVHEEEAPAPAPSQFAEDDESTFDDDGVPLWIVPVRPPDLPPMLPPGRAKIPVVSVEEATDQIYDFFDAAMEDHTVIMPEIVRRRYRYNASDDEAKRHRAIHAFAASIRKLTDLPHTGWFNAFAVVAGLDGENWSPRGLDLVAALLTHVVRGQPLRGSRTLPVPTIREWDLDVAPGAIATAATEALQFIATPDDLRKFRALLKNEPLTIERALDLAMNFYKERSRSVVSALTELLTDRKNLFSSGYTCTYDAWYKSAPLLLRSAKNDDPASLTDRIVAVWRYLGDVAKKKRQEASTTRKRSPPPSARRRRTMDTNPMLSFDPLEYARACYAHELFPRREIDDIIIEAEAP